MSLCEEGPPMALSFSFALLQSKGKSDNDRDDDRRGNAGTGVVTVKTSVLETFISPSLGLFEKFGYP